MFGNFLTKGPKFHFVQTGAGNQTPDMSTHNCRHGPKPGSQLPRVTCTPPGTYTNAPCTGGVQTHPQGSLHIRTHAPNRTLGQMPKPLVRAAQSLGPCGVREPVACHRCPSLPGLQPPPSSGRRAQPARGFYQRHGCALHPGLEALAKVYPSHYAVYWACPPHGTITGRTRSRSPRAEQQGSGETSGGEWGTRRWGQCGEGCHGHC